GFSRPGLGLLGFGHVEVGTVTPRPQPGNPRPRIFRLVEEQGVINRMGFPNQGAEAVLPRLKSPRRGGLVLGVNIGKNKDTPLEAACEDYLDLLRQFAPVADYLTINVSSPNTQGLRLLQTRAALYGLLPPLAAEREHLRRELGKPLPLLVKLAPDLSPVELDGALQAVLDTGMDGVVLSNTTIKRDHVDSPVQKETGGLSGAPLKERSTEMIRQVSYRTCGKLPIVANGGIMSPEDAREKMEAGASLVQLYSGLIYRGPGLVRQILMS
ncbi:MAG: quinone-dependent dihydroorotate dehydrogenase, partial [Chloroflexi bacterium]|nr:quinone-dependent dihydroorotate dehydrogenase [Chloroflexota bacterium]